MNDDYIVTVYVTIDEVLQIIDYQDDERASTSATEIMTIAVIAAKYFQNHHEREHLWQKALALYSVFEVYKERADHREIPVVVLTPQ